jgi:hypothetical protein
MLYFLSLLLENSFIKKEVCAKSSCANLLKVLLIIIQWHGSCLLLTSIFDKSKLVWVYLVLSTVSLFLSNEHATPLCGHYGGRHW